MGSDVRGELELLLAPAMGALGVILISTASGLIDWGHALLVGGGLAVAMYAIGAGRKLVSRKRFMIYEVEAEDSRLAARKIRVLGEILQAIGKSRGVGALLHACGKRGCRLLVLVPNEDGLDTVLRGLLDGLRFHKYSVDSLDALLRVEGGAGAPLFDAIAYSLESLPASGLTRGEILLGYSEDGNAVYAMVDEFWRHASVFGTTGSGKTSTTAFIAAQLARYVRVIIFDWHGEYEALYEKLGFHEYTALDPPKLPLIPDDLDLEVAVDVIEDTFDLTRHQSMLLYQALKSMRRRDAVPKNMDEFIENLLATIEVQGSIPSRAELEIRAALERRLRSLMTGEGERYFNVTGSIDLPSDKGLYIIRVNRILLLPLRRTYVRMMLAYLFYSAIAQNRILNTIVVLEEAQNIASSDTRTVPSILAEARKRRLGLIIVSQSPSSLHPSIMKNTNIRIVHTLKSAQDINVVSRSMSLPEHLRMKLSKLPVGKAIVDTPQLETPVLIHVPVYEQINKEQG